MNKKQVEMWSPWLLLVAVLVLWQIICAGFEVSEFIFPSPSRIWNQFCRSDNADETEICKV